jgi:O-methyltransferase
MGALSRYKPFKKAFWSFALGWLRRSLPDIPTNAALTVSDPAFFFAWIRVQSRTLLPYRRLKGLYDAVAQVSRDQISGDIVECGTARGGSLALLALATRRFDAARTVWSFDTFEGIPAPTSEDPDYEFARRFTGHFRGSADEIIAWLSSLNLGSVRLTKGLFQDTLPRSIVGPIAVLHLDGDWYESTRCCLDNLYDRVVPGGVIQIDDYGYWAGAKKATDEFLTARGISEPLYRIDSSARQLRKP